MSTPACNGNMLPREPKRTSAIDEEREQQHNSGGENEISSQKAAEQKEEKNPTITNSHWENSNGETITKALVGDEGLRMKKNPQEGLLKN